MTGEESYRPSNREGRVPLAAVAGLRRAGAHSFQVRAFDISPTGCKVEFVEKPLVNEHLWIKFDGLEAMGATVRWTDGMVGGLQFDRPIHPAVFGKLLSDLK